MRILLTSFFLAIIVSTSAWSQRLPSNLTDKEELEVKSFAATFYNRLHDSRDVSPLIKEFFVSDFAQRLAFCRTSQECGGFARDFWQGDESYVKLGLQPQDWVRQYASAINYFSIYSQSQKSLTQVAGKKLVDYEDESKKLIDVRLAVLLKNDPKALELDFFGNPDRVVPEERSAQSIRKETASFERLVDAVRIVEAEAKAELRRSKPNHDFLIKPDMFWARAEPTTTKFFNYPLGTRMIEVWPEGEDIPFKMDLIKQNGKLRIVAIYPPID